jgi:hypothetical protein
LKLPTIYREKVACGQAEEVDQVDATGHDSLAHGWNGS